MASVPQRDSKPEVALRHVLYRRGYRYRLHGRHLPGRPDFYLTRFRVAVFVHGCFWHRHEGCPRTTMPKINHEFWQAKFEANVARDRRNEDALRASGWTPVVVWECEIKRDVEAAADRVMAVINGTARQ